MVKEVKKDALKWHINIFRRIGSAWCSIKSVPIIWKKFDSFTVSTNKIAIYSKKRKIRGIWIFIDQDWKISVINERTIFQKFYVSLSKLQNSKIYWNSSNLVYVIGFW